MIRTWIMIGAMVTQKYCNELGTDNFFSFTFQENQTLYSSSHWHT